MSTSINDLYSRTISLFVFSRHFLTTIEFPLSINLGSSQHVPILRSVERQGLKNYPLSIFFDPFFLFLFSVRFLKIQRHFPKIQRPTFVLLYWSILEMMEGLGFLQWCTRVVSKVIFPKFVRSHEWMEWNQINGKTKFWVAGLKCKQSEDLWIITLWQLCIGWSI